MFSVMFLVNTTHLGGTDGEAMKPGKDKETAI